MEKESFVAPLSIKSNKERQSFKGISKEYTNEIMGGTLGLAASLPIGYAFGRGLQKVPAIGKNPRLAKFMQAHLKVVPTKVMRTAAKKMISSTSKNSLALKRIDIATSKYIRAGAKKWIGKPKNLSMLAGIMIVGTVGSYLGGKSSIRKMEKKDNLPPVDPELIAARRAAGMFIPDIVKPLEMVAYYGITKKYLKDKDKKMNKTGKVMKCPEMIKEAMSPYAKGALIGGGLLGGTTFMSNLLMKQKDGKKMKFSKVLGRTALGTAAGAGFGALGVKGLRSARSYGIGDAATEIGASLGAL